MNKMNKAQQVCDAYDTPWGEGMGSDACYSFAIEAAHDLGGVELWNSNVGNRTYSFAPSRTFEFDDGTVVTVTYGSAFEGEIES